MENVLSPITVSPPPPSSSPSKSNILMLYYGLVVVVAGAIALVLYNYLVIKRCSRGHVNQPRHLDNSNEIVEVVVRGRTDGNMTTENYSQSRRNLLSSFKYTKEREKEGRKENGFEEDDNYDECPICLSRFEEGEEVRKLPRCKHSFHAQCIDMWLYSHFDCPVCRTPVGPCCRLFLPENYSGSHEELPEPDGDGGALPTWGVTTAT